MDQWEDIIDSYNDPPDIRYLAKLLQTAGVVLKEDLANFEIEWIIETLLSKPVNLLTTISEKRNNNDWSKTNENSFKLLTEIVRTHHEYVTRYHEDIVKLCLLQYDAETRKAAITCLTEIVKHFPYDPVNVKKHIVALDNCTTCRAPLALLVGAVCKYHPELVGDHFSTIWRIYLNMLDNNKNTNQITSAVLQGIHDLFEYYGRELQTMELATFYDKMTREYLQKSKCDSVCLSILENYSCLFREKLAKDAAILNYLWTKLADGLSTNCVLNVYRDVLEAVKHDRNKLEQIIADLLPRTQSTHWAVRHVSLSIVYTARTRYGVMIEVGHPDVQVLEFELRSGPVGLSHANGIAFCIEACLPNSDKLLQTAVLFYDNLPATKRKEIVVNNIMKASEELRTSTINFLINETCQDENSLEKHQPLWNDLCDHDSSDKVFDDVLKYAIFVLQNLKDEGIETLPPQINNLLTLCSHLVSLLGDDSRSRERCLSLAATVKGFPAPQLWRELALCGAEGVPYQDFDIQRCTDEQTLCDYCLIVINAPVECIDINNVLAAFQIIFSRKDVEPKTLSQALKKFEAIINSIEEYELNKTMISDIVRAIEKLSGRKDLVGKDARILRRDVIMFLGKYGNNSYLKESDHSLNRLIARLNDELTLTVPNPYEGNNYKINLHKILRLALIHENAEALQILVTIIYAKLSSNNSTALQSALCEAIVCICKSIARGDHSGTLPTAALKGSFGANLVTHIKKEKSPGVRKLLCDIIEELMTRDPNSDETDDLVMTVAEQIEILTNGPSVTTKIAGIEITRTLLNSLKNNNLLSRKLLPNIIINISKSREIDSYNIFEEATRIFVEKIDLFDDEIDMLINKLLEELLQDGGPNKMADDRVLKIFRKTVKMDLRFVKNLSGIKNYEKRNVIEKYLSISGKLTVNFSTNLYVLSELKRIFDFEADLCKYVVAYNDCYATYKLFCMEMKDVFCMEAVLGFLEEYSDIVLELQYENTLKYISSMLNNFTPNDITQIDRPFKSCLKKYTNKFKNTPKLLQKSIENWCNNLNLSGITHALEKDCYTPEDAITVHSLKIMLNSINDSDLSLLTDVKIETKKWSRILLKSFANGYLSRMTSKLTYLSDLLTVSVKMSQEEIKKILLEGHNLHGVPNERIGVKFARFFINVFFEYLIETPFILLDEDMTTCCILLNDIAKYALKKKCTDIQYDQILELVDKLWPTYKSKTTFSEKHTLLLDLTGLPKCLRRESNPMKWACDVIQSDAAREEKARLLSVLPGGKEYISVYNTFACILPSRLSELSVQTSATLRALLDGLSASADLRLVEIVMALAAGDDTKGWWDDAITTCMASLASKAGLDLYRAVYTRNWIGPSMGVCTRVLVPLLRYSSSQKCESFYSSILGDLMPRLKRGCREGASPSDFQKYIVDYTRAFVLITIAFEKVPQTSIESPTSPLYRESGIAADKSWYLVREACKWDQTLSNMVIRTCPPSDQLKEVCRMFHCASYNCSTAALCLYKPAPKKYSHVLGADRWGRLVDCTRLYHLPLVNKWNRRSKPQPSSIAVQSRSTSLHTATSARTRLFLRTLSECVLQYDLHAEENSNDVVTQELQLSETELNQHECAPTLTSLLCHLSTVESDWPDVLASTLTGDCHRNVKFLLAQVICNAREELKTQANTLRPALLAMVTSTLQCETGTALLNGLHVDVLETLIFWSDTDPKPLDNLNKTVSCLLITCLENRQRQSIYKMLLDVADRLLNLYGSVLKLEWSVFEKYLQETSQDAPKTLEVLKHVTKYNVYIPELLSNILDKLTTMKYQLSTLSELFGLALSCCETANCSAANTSTANSSTAKREIERALARWRQVLESKRSQGAEYVRMLYYAQMKYKGCCDEARFRVITDLTSKMPTEDKKKCLRILSSYLSTNPPSDSVEDMFCSVDLSEVVMGPCGADGFPVVLHGLRVLPAGKRNALVMQVAGYCQHSVVKIRKGSLEVMLQAFKDLFSNPDPTHAPKKPRTSLTTPILNATESKDVITDTILRCISLGLSDSNEDLSNMMRAGVSECLFGDDMGVRFLESFILTIFIPIISKRTNNLDLSVCLSAMLDLLFSGLRKQDRFQRLKLRDEPILMRESNFGSSKLLTTSRTCVGTFRTTALSKKRRNLKTEEDTNKPDVDVQVSIDSILETLLQFMKKVPEASHAFLTELTSCLTTDSPTFDSRAALAKLLSSALDCEPCELTPVVLLLVDECIESVFKENGIQSKLDTLKCLTLNSEATFHLTLLCEEVKLLNSACDQPLFEVSYGDVGDVNMGAAQFCVDDLKFVFGKLSNWDSLTCQQKGRVLSEGLPPLWTDVQTFVACISDYIDTQGWFSKMVSAYKQEDRQSSIKWLREVDKWPRKRFDISATTEAIEYLDRLENNQTKFNCDIQPSDCLAEWAARFMIRTAYLTSLQTDNPSQVQKQSRAYELKWCERANELALPQCVLDCVKRNAEELYRSETVSWLCQRVEALRTMGLQTRDNTVLERALDTAETYAPDFLNDSSLQYVIKINLLTIQLQYDLKKSSKENIQNIFDVIQKFISENDFVMMRKCKVMMWSICEVALNYYDDVFSDATDQNEIITEMLRILEYSIDSNIPNGNLILCLILDKMATFNGRALNRSTAKKLLDTVKRIHANLNDFTLEALRSYAHLLPSLSLAEYSFMSDRDSDEILKYKKCFQLIGDAEFMLVQYGDDLFRALKNNDANEWKKVFDRMKCKMFENEYAGVDYQLLNKYKIKLYEISDFASTPTFKTQAETVLLEIRTLRSRPVHSSVRLKQVCPALAVGVGNQWVNSALSLPPGVHVISFDDQVSVFTDSIRRPCVLRARLSDGTSRRYLIKPGECLRTDAAAVSLCRAFAALAGARCTAYQVTPLSEDCGLIEFLEDHERLRSVISASQDINSAVYQTNRPSDDELILAPLPAALRHHRTLCSHVPSRLLLSTVKRDTVTIEEYCNRRMTFTESVTAYALIGWILGLGDRHLQNILYSTEDSSICLVDWNALFQYGVGELPPARITRNMMAFCDVQVLESRLQSLLSSLRNSPKIFLAVTKITFQWMGKQFEDKYPYIEDILKGKSRCQDVTKDAIEKSKIKFKNKYIELLDNVFEDWPSKENYSVVEQISCFLLQCTDNRILAVTRSGWEPWV